jgi:hypothetical protein
MIQLHTLVSRYPIFPASFVDKTDFSSLNGLGILVKNHLISVLEYVPNMNKTLDLIPSIVKKKQGHIYDSSFLDSWSYSINLYI